MVRPLPRHSLLLTQWLLLGAALIILGSGTGYGLYNERQRIQEREEGWLLAMSHVMQLSVEQNLGSINRALGILIGELKNPKTHDDFNQHLFSLTEAMPSVHSIQVHDATGKILYSSQQILLHASTDFSQQDYFRTPQQHPSVDTLFISPPYHTIEGVYTLAATRMITDSNGQFAGIIVAQLYPEYFDPMLNAVRYASNMAASLHHGDGVLFLMYPHDRQELVGKDLTRPGYFFLRHRESGKSATVFSGFLPGLGEERMIAHRDIQPPELNMDKPLGVAISRPIADIYSLWKHDVVIASTLFGVTFVTLGLGLYAYQRRLRQFLKNETQASQALAASEWKLRTIIEAEPECVMLMAPDGTLLQINPAGLALIECDNEEQAIGQRFSIFLAPEYAEPFAAVNAKTRQGEVGTLEHEIIGRRGSRRWVDSHFAPMRDINGNIVGQLAVTRDFSERKKVEQELERLAQTDSLTGLANRRHFMLQAEQELSRAQRYGGLLSLLMMDIDRFKLINDTYGHQTGDVVLQSIGEMCREALREVDQVGRIGGEEFAVLLPETDAAQALEVADRLRLMAAQRGVFLDNGQRLLFSISLGVTTLTSGKATIDTLLGQADQAMYQAKRSGRNRVCVFDPANPAHTRFPSEQ